MEEQGSHNHRSALGHGHYVLAASVARAGAALLEAEAVPTQVTSDSKLIGYALGWEVCVPASMLQGAHELLAPSRFTDAELEYLATGILAGGKEGTDDLHQQP